MYSEHFTPSRRNLRQVGFKKHELEDSQTVYKIELKHLGMQISTGILQNKNWQKHCTVSDSEGNVLFYFDAKRDASPMGHLIALEWSIANKISDAYGTLNNFKSARK